MGDSREPALPSPLRRISADGPAQKCPVSGKGILKMDCRWRNYFIFFRIVFRICNVSPVLQAASGLVPRLVLFFPFFLSCLCFSGQRAHSGARKLLGSTADCAALAHVLLLHRSPTCVRSLFFFLG